MPETILEHELETILRNDGWAFLIFVVICWVIGTCKMCGLFDGNPWMPRTE
jgi:hypothetical protein